MTRKRVHWGQAPFRVNDDPEISQLDAEYDPELGQSDPIILSSLQKADQIPGHFWPGTEYDPNGPFFRVTLTRVYLEWTFYYTCTLNVTIAQVGVFLPDIVRVRTLVGFILVNYTINVCQVFAQFCRTLW